MAVIKLGTSKQANRLINYCDKKATERDSIACDPSMAKEQFAATRVIWGKEDGVQAHHVIMSFPPYHDNMTQQEVAAAARELVEKLAPNHEAAIFVHTDKDHWHAHAVINSVNIQSGRKLHLNKADYFKAQTLADTICKNRGWHTIDKPFQKDRYNLAERAVKASGAVSWKDQLRDWINTAKLQSNSLNELKNRLKADYGVEMKIQEKNISFLHPEAQRFVRGKTLGDAYTKEGISFGKEGAVRQSERSSPGISSTAIGSHSADQLADREHKTERKQSIYTTRKSNKASESTGNILEKSRQQLKQHQERFGSRDAKSEATATKSNGTSKVGASEDFKTASEGFSGNISRSSNNNSLVVALNLINAEISRLEASVHHQNQESTKPKARIKGRMIKDQEYER